jgi:hypothetical protein
MLATASIFLLGYYFPGELWAGSNLFFLPLQVQIILWVMLLSACFADVDNILIEALGKLGDWLFKTCRRRREIAIFSIFFAILFILRCRNMVWGDSHMFPAVITNFPGTEAVLPHHYGTAFLYKIVYIITRRLLFVMGFSKQLGWTFGFNLITAVTGGFFAIIASRIAAISGRDGFEKAAIFFGIMFSGVSLVFTHIEFYAPSLVMASWCIYLSILAARREISQGWLFVLPMLGAIALNPVFVYLAIIVIYFLFTRRKFVLLSILVTAGCAAVYTILAFSTNMPFENQILLSADMEYVFSGRHILNLANFLFFAMPAILVLPFVDRRDDVSRLLGGLSVPALFMVFFLKFDYGAMDWDLAVTILLPVALIGSLSIARIPRKAASVILIAMFITFVSWLYLNANLERGLEKAESTILVQQTEYFRKKPPEERLLQIYHRNIFRRERHERIAKWSSICRGEHPYRVMPYIYAIFVELEKDNPGHAAYLALRAFDKTNIERRLLPTVINIIAESDKADLETVLVNIEKGGTPTSFTQSFPVDKQLESEMFRLAHPDSVPDTSRPQSMVEVLHIAGYISYYASIGDLQKATIAFEGGKKLYPNAPSIYNNWGIILNYLRKTDEARDAFEQARSFGGDEGNFYSNMASSYYNDGDYIEAERFILHALDVEPAKAMFNINHAAILFRLGRRDEGITKLREYISRADYESAKLTESFMREFGGFNE